MKQVKVKNIAKLFVGIIGQTAGVRFFFWCLGKVNKFTMLIAKPIFSGEPVDNLDGILTNTTLVFIIFLVVIVGWLIAISDEN